GIGEARLFVVGDRRDLLRPLAARQVGLDLGAQRAARGAARETSGREPAMKSRPYAVRSVGSGLESVRWSSKALVEEVLGRAGIRIDGPAPWDIQVLDERFYDSVLTRGTLGLGESYMDGWWDCVHLDQFMERAIRHKLKDWQPRNWKILLSLLRLRLLNLQSIPGSLRVAETHYNLGNDFFARMLGPTMTYSCGYWPAAADLDEAQDRKHDLICDKLHLESHHRLLDIGCGWGRLLAHAARRTGCRGVGVTISEPQLQYATQTHEGLPVEFSLVDYRNPSIDGHGKFDRIVSV